jgi:GNAT superfamily N-acetyltransferase
MAYDLSATFDQVSLRPVGFDDWASVRYVHATAFGTLGHRHHTRAEIDAFARRVRSHGYAAQMQREHLVAAWLEGELVGTAGWTPADDSGVLARITSVFVRPLFTCGGIGTRLVSDAEARARAAGFERFSARVPLNAVGFFEKLGYEVSSHGVHALTNEHCMQVVYMRKKPSAQEPAEARRAAPAAAAQDA